MKPHAGHFNAKHATRREYLIAKTERFELIESFEVNWKEFFAVHATIQFTINLEVLE